ncbi:nitroreductase [Gordonibacter sp. 28C]|uniref:nitroreductase family protein n=1 Tax=Gordonibacter sp. 28C TaxID=2078569 RepID=UPI000DF7AA29|nr:nitroreductase family protein [Gordonibacter sp. 28C]RDB64429.1 nitroreductase [Gordonibacter sp. 28C]
MELLQVLKSRRSVRKYKSDPIPMDQLHEIMSAAVSAPSAKNLQPWYFVVLTDGEEMNEASRIMQGCSATMKRELAERFVNNPEIVDETMTFLSAFGGAPCLVLVFAYSAEYRKDWEWDVIQSAAAACENLILAAWDKGIGSCWMTAPLRVSAEMEHAFAPDHGFMISAITLGYPEEASRDVRRKDGRVTFR